MFIDGVSGVICVLGEQKFNFGFGKGLIVNFVFGDYVLMVEVVCEVGGCELVKVLFQWLFKVVQSVKV